MKTVLRWIAVALLAVLISLVLTPAHAWASKTLVEYDAEIATQEELLEQKQADLEAKQQVLGAAVRTVYKDYNTQSILDLLMDEEDLKTVLLRIDYVNQVSDHYHQAFEEVLDAKMKVEETVRELEIMRMERQNRAASADEAALIHYSQSGEEWSSLPYWGVSISYAGCGLCAYTTIIDILLNEDYTPADMLDMRGDWRGMDHWVYDSTGTPDGSTHYDWTLNNFEIETYDIDRDTSDLADELSHDDRAALMLVGGVGLKTNSGGRWYTDGHFIAVYDYDDEGFHVHDSALSKSEGSNVIYSWSDMESLMSGAKRLVIYKNV